MQLPFHHEELGVKQQFLELARDFRASDQVEKQLAAVLLYANLSEYLSYHLTESLKQIIFSGSKSFWNGTVYVDMRSTTEKMTMGQIAKELRAFGFPSKEIIVPLIERIAKNRNKIMHEMLRTPAGQLEAIDTAMFELAEDSEQLIIAVDDIYRGLPPSNITQSINSEGNGAEVEAVESASGEIVVQPKEEAKSKHVLSKDSKNKQGNKT